MATAVAAQNTTIYVSTYPPHSHSSNTTTGMEVITFFILMFLIFSCFIGFSYDYNYRWDYYSTGPHRSNAYPVAQRV